MSFEAVSKYLCNNGFKDRLIVFSSSSATVSLAAAEIGCEENRIAKSISFSVFGKPVLVVCSGDCKIDNTKFKEYFKTKASMLQRDEVLSLIGHDCGGVCPFCLNDGVEVYLDKSIFRFDFVYPAAGSHNSVVKLSPNELKTLCAFKEIIDICKTATVFNGV